MARSRNIKPGFFQNEELADCGMDGQLLFAGLWTLADREGRLEDRPRRIKAQIFPYSNIDAEKVLMKLQKNRFINRYSVNGDQYIQILSFNKHQNPHHKEQASTLPAPDKPQTSPVKASTCPKDAVLIPDSLNLGTDSLEPDSLNNIYSERFEVSWKTYPKRAGSNPKKAAYKAWKARGAEAVFDMNLGTCKYANFCKATGKIGTEYVMQAKTFFGPDRHYLEDWNLPAPDKKPWKMSDNEVLAECKELGVRTKGKNKKQLHAEMLEKRK